VSHLHAKFKGVTVTKRLGLNIHKLRVEARLTQNELSELAEIDRSFVQRVEAGSNSPSAEVLVRLRRALKCTWDQLFHGVDDDFKMTLK
jgi:transcriptional regulator with XRE-family HTH domain